MARAQRTTEVVRQPKRVTRVQLTLTEGEADFLLAVLAKIGGHPKNSPRKYAERISEALKNTLGISYKKTDAFPLSSGYLYFIDYADPDGGYEGSTKQKVESAIASIVQRYGLAGL